MKYSVIIPAYNEEKRIGPVIDKIKETFSNNDYEIIVVDDGSVDSTYELAKSKGVFVIRHEKNKGKGAAIKTGFSNANGDVVGFIDSDRSVDSYYIKKIFDFVVSNDCDIVIASRSVPESKIIVPAPLARRIASKIFSFFVRFLFGLKFKDTQCGCKAMKCIVAKNLSKEIKSNGFEFDVEFLWRAKNYGYKIVEIPIEWKHERDSKFSLIYGFKMVISLIKIRFNL